MKLDIYRGTQSSVIASTSAFEVNRTLMEVRKITCNMKSVIPIEWTPYNGGTYDFVMYNSEKYILYAKPTSEERNEVGQITYKLTFSGQEILLQNAPFLDVVTGTGSSIDEYRYTNGSIVNFFGDIRQFVLRLNANITYFNNHGGDLAGWTVELDLSSDYDYREFNVSSANSSLLDALKMINSAYSLKYYFDTKGANKKVIITDKVRSSIDYVFQQGEGNGLYNLSATVSADKDVVTRLRPLGGSRNIPTDYKKDAKPIDNTRYCPNLMLPNDANGNIVYTIDSASGIQKYGIREKSVTQEFEGIYPSIRSVTLRDVYGTSSLPTTGNDGVKLTGLSASQRVDQIIGSSQVLNEQQNYFYVYLTDIGFYLDKTNEDGVYVYATTNEAVISMRTGLYTGVEFTIVKGKTKQLTGGTEDNPDADIAQTATDVEMYNAGARYRVKLMRTEDNGAKFPSANTLTPALSAGSEFVILNIFMPPVYVTMAENKLKQAAMEFLSIYDHSLYTIGLNVATGFTIEHPEIFPDQFLEGSRLKVKSNKIGVLDDAGGPIEINVQSVTVRYTEKSVFPTYDCTLAEIKKQTIFEQLSSEIRNVSASQTSLQSAGLSASAVSDILQRLQIIGNMFEWDKERTAIKAKFNLYGVGEITAYGYGPDVPWTTSLGNLTNVVNNADDVAGVDYILFKAKGASTWTLKDATDIGGGKGKIYYAGSGITLTDSNGDTANTINVRFGQGAGLVMEGSDSRVLTAISDISNIKKTTFWGQTMTNNKVEGALTNTGSLTPSATGVSDLGSATLKYRNVYASLVGNAATATKLKTPVDIWGQPFDGSAPIVGDMMGVSIINKTIFLSGNRVGINHPTPDCALHVSGTIKATGEVVAYATSDYDPSQEFPKATKTSYGWVQIGENINVVNGVISAAKQGLDETQLAAYLAANNYLNASNYTTYTVTKTGTGATGTWSISISGNAANATTATSAGKLATARTLWGQSFDGSGNVSGNISSTGNITPSATGVSDIGSTALKYRNIYGNLVGNVSGNVSGTLTGNVTGNVSGSAGSLATTRTIWGQNFNGTQNVSGAMSGVSNINSIIYISGTNVGIRKSTPAVSLDITGDVQSSGTIKAGGEVVAYATSDYDPSQDIPKASKTSYGWVKIGDNINVVDGVISAAKQGMDETALAAYLSSKGYLNSTNYTNYTVTKTGGGATGTWGIGISGNAATATTATSAGKLTTARNIALSGAVTGSANFDGSTNITIATSFAQNFDSKYVLKTGDTMSGNLTLNDSAATGARILKFTGYTDYAHIKFSAATSDNSYLEIATGNNGNTPIYIRQYNTSGAVVRTLTLLDAIGRSIFPGQVMCNSRGTDTYDGAIQIRENKEGGLLNGNWNEGPRITFHWGNRVAQAFGLLADGNLHRHGNKIWDAANDGTGSGLDADLLDGLHGSSYLTVSGYASTLDSRYVKKSGDTMTGILNVSNINSIIYISGTNVGIRKSTPAVSLDITGDVQSSGTIKAGGEVVAYATSDYDPSQDIPKASKTSYGWVKIGDNINVVDGVISAAKQGMDETALAAYLSSKGYLNSTNYTNYTVTKTGGGATGTWGIGISGNAATATTSTSAGKLTTARNIALSGAVTGSANFDGSTNITIATSFAQNFDSKYVLKTGDTMSGNLTLNDSAATGARMLKFTGYTDYAHIKFSAATSDNSYLEIATGDNGNTPIYIRQYNTSGSVVRTLTLLDTVGCSRFPGKIFCRSAGTDTYHGAIEIRENNEGGALNGNWNEGPRIIFHWGKRKVRAFGLLADGYLHRHGNKIWDAGNDGAGSGLDADLLDGKQGNTYMSFQRLNIDANNYNSIGVWESNTSTNMPTTNGWHQVMSWGTGDSAYGFQMANTYTTNGHMFYRHKVAGTWHQWREILDHVNYLNHADSRYVKKSGDTMTGILNVSTIKSTIGFGGSAYMSKCLASFKYNGSATKGIIKITLPFSWTNSMNVYRIVVYEYNEYAGSEILVSGYDYNPDNSWFQYGVVINGGYNKGVRLAYDGSKTCILLGNVQTLWNYPAVFLDTVYASFSGATTNNWASQNYNISLITSETGLSSITGVSDKMQDRYDYRYVNVTGDTITGHLTVNGSITAGNAINCSTLTASGALKGSGLNVASIELSGATPYIDFHYGSSSQDYTSRIIASSASELAISNGWRVGGTTISSGGYVVNQAAGTGIGINLYVGSSANNPTYGIMFATTGNYVRFGTVNGDWATYFNMSSDPGKGWIFRGGTVAKASISNYGDIYAARNMVAYGEVTAYSTSDIRLKKNIKPIKNPFVILKRSQPVLFEWNDTAFEFNKEKEKGIVPGLIAQWEQSVLPIAIHTMYEEYLGINYENYIPYLIAGINEHEDEIQRLKCKVRELENKLAKYVA